MLHQSLRQVATVALLAVAVSACASAQMRLKPFAPRHVPTRTDLRVAVLPFGDARGHEEDGLSAWVFVPLIPWTSSIDERADERLVERDSPEHFRLQVAQLLTRHLSQMGIFAKVQYVADGHVDPAQWDLVLSGDLRASTRYELRTFYGLSLAGPVLWALGAPMGYDEVTWRLDLALRDPKTDAVLKTIRCDRQETHWKGLYWGTGGFPDVEAESFKNLLDAVFAEVDRALDTVPELMALSASPAATAYVPAHATQPRRRQRVNTGTAVVLAERMLEDDARAAFVELVVAEVQRQSTGKVLGSDDLNTLLSFERLNDLLGCTDAACYAEIGSATNADLVLSLNAGVLGGEQALTLKAIRPRDGTVVSRTTWRATGQDLGAFVPRLPDIVAEALKPIARGRQSAE